MPAALRLRCRALALADAARAAASGMAPQTRPSSFWKIYEKKVRMVSSRNVEVRNGHNLFVAQAQLRMPAPYPVQSIATATLKRTFSNGHTYTSIASSFSPDGETYLSADDLRINLWNLATNRSTFNIVDIKPDDMEELSE